jgi:hypothetical protein
MRWALIRLARRLVSILWASAVAALPAPTKREGVLGQLNEVGLTERRDDGVEVELEEREECVVGDVSRCDDE